jgi:hypothetical protein
MRTVVLRKGYQVNWKLSREGREESGGHQASVWSPVEVQQKVASAECSKGTYTICDISELALYKGIGHSVSISLVFS